MNGAFVRDNGERIVISTFNLAPNVNRRNCLKFRYGSEFVFRVIMKNSANFVTVPNLSGTISALQRNTQPTQSKKKKCTGLHQFLTSKLAYELLMKLELTFICFGTSRTVHKITACELKLYLSGVFMRLSKSRTIKSFVICKYN